MTDASLNTRHHEPPYDPALESAVDLCYVEAMRREDVIATLRAHAPALRHHGVRHAALFGSLARGEDTSSSDIDIMIELDPDAAVDLFGYLGITHYLADLFPARVDVANKETLRPHVRPNAERDALYAF